MMSGENEEENQEHHEQYLEGLNGSTRGRGRGSSAENAEESGDDDHNENQCDLEQAYEELGGAAMTAVSTTDERICCSQQFGDTEEVETGRSRDNVVATPSGEEGGEASASEPQTLREDAPNLTAHPNMHEATLQRFHEQIDTNTNQDNSNTDDDNNNEDNDADDGNDSTTNFNGNDNTNNDDNDISNDNSTSNDDDNETTNGAHSDNKNDDTETTEGRDNADDNEPNLHEATLQRLPEQTDTNTSQDNSSTDDDNNNEDNNADEGNDNTKFNGNDNTNNDDNDIANDNSTSIDDDNDTSNGVHSEKNDDTETMEGRDNTDDNDEVGNSQESKDDQKDNAEMDDELGDPAKEDVGAKTLEAGSNSSTKYHWKQKNADGTIRNLPPPPIRYREAERRGHVHPNPPQSRHRRWIRFISPGAVQMRGRPPYSGHRSGHVQRQQRQRQRRRVEQEVEDEKKEEERQTTQDTTPNQDDGMIAKNDNSSNRVARSVDNITRSNHNSDNGRSEINNNDNNNNGNPPVGITMPLPANVHFPGRAITEPNHEIDLVEGIRLEEGESFNEQKKDADKVLKRTKKRDILVAASLSLIVIVLFLVLFSVPISSFSEESKASGKSGVATPAPTASNHPSTAPTMLNQGELLQMLQSTSSLEDLQRPQSPQNRAMEWLLEDATTGNETQRLLQRFVLAVFCFSLDWKDCEFSLRFMTGKDECQWEGNTCDEEGFVTEISLMRGRGAGLVPRVVGTLPSELGALSELRVLSVVFHRNLQGTIPPEIGLGARKLRFLRLSSNDLRGPFPSTFRYHLRLLSVRLDGNPHFGGGLSTLLATLPRVLLIDLNGCGLTGTIPTEFGRMTQLAQNRTNSKTLTQWLPSDLLHLTFPSFQENFFLSSNHLTGRLPSELGGLSSLQSLQLSDNQLSGSIPRNLLLDAWPNLQALSLNDNNLDGTLSWKALSVFSWGVQTTEAKTLDFSNNKIGGTIPSSFGSIHPLRKLELHGNNFEGRMPSQVCELVERPQFQDRLLSLTADCKSAKDGTEEVDCDCCTKCY